MTKRKQLSKIIPGIVLLVVLVSLFVFFGSAKFLDRRRGFTQFDVANFNAIILGNTSLEELKAGTIYDFAETSGTESYPGMEQKELYFSIANGVSFKEEQTDAEGNVQTSITDNASDTMIEYSIRLLTTGNMPINFRLVKLAADGTDEASLKTEFVESSYLDEDLRNGDPKTADTSIDGTKWNIYRFMEPLGEGLPDTEASFTLTGGELNLNRYKLILDWPIESAVTDENGIQLMKASNSQDYRKEFDNLQLLVTVKSKDQTEEIAVPVDTEDLLFDRYSKGIIITIPSLSEADSYEEKRGLYTYDHIIDLRAFERDEAAAETDLGTYEFDVNNGVTLGQASFYACEGDSCPVQFTYYVMQVLFPAEETAGYSYQMSFRDSNDLDDDRDTKEYLPLYVIPENTEYWIINETTGVVETKSKTYIEKLDAEDPESIYRTYRVDTLAWARSGQTSGYHTDRAFSIAPGSEFPNNSAVFRMTNAEKATGSEEWQAQSSVTRFRMQLIGDPDQIKHSIYNQLQKDADDAENADPEALTLNQVKPWQFAFLNKFTVRINAVYSDKTNFSATANRVDLFTKKSVIPPAEETAEETTEEPAENPTE